MKAIYEFSFIGKRYGELKEGTIVATNRDEAIKKLFRHFSVGELLHMSFKRLA